MSKRPTDSTTPEPIYHKKQKVKTDPDTEPTLAPETVPEDTQVTVSIENDKDVPATADDTQHQENEDSDSEDTASASKSQKKPPIGDSFDDFKRDIDIPPVNKFWGIKPLPGDPRPDPVQPSARDSNGQTNPPMWEERGYRYKRGSRYVKYFGPIPPDNVNELEAKLDQEDLLVVKLIDMRPKTKTNLRPRRRPTIYCYGKVPKDWDDMDALKALNDRRYQAIDRITMDAPWTRIEREYLASLLAEDPNASIWDLTERHNDRFMNKDFTGDTGFGFGNLSTGRTVESVRHQYLTFKPLYDQGKAPDRVRWRGDQSLEAKTIRASGRAVQAFGPPSRALELAHDAEHGGAEDGEEDGSEEDDEASKKRIDKRSQHDPFAGQDALDDDDELLLELAGAYDSETPESPTPDERATAEAEGETEFSTVAQEHDRLEMLDSKSASAENEIQNVIVQDLEHAHHSVEHCARTSILQGDRKLSNITPRMEMNENYDD